MKILLFGKNGQVGWELNRSLQPLGEVVALNREEADFSLPEALRQVIRDVNPDVIVNAVAYTAVDKAEESESLALKINGEALSILADEALRINALLVHYSTDYVFDGRCPNSYLEQISASEQSPLRHAVSYTPAILSLKACLPEGQIAPRLLCTCLSGPVLDQE